MFKKIIAYAISFFFAVGMMYAQEEMAVLPEAVSQKVEETSAPEKQDHKKITSENKGDAHTEQASEEDSEDLDAFLNELQEELKKHEATVSESAE